jgi:hypothetical protein
MSSSPAHADPLRLTINPYGDIEWCGPRAGLEAMGLIPANFKWPNRIDYAFWHADGFEFALRRCRPNGMMGPMRHWMNYDYWMVQRFMPRSLQDMWRIHEPYRDLGDILFRATRPGETLLLKFSTVHPDKGRESFEARLASLPAKRRRAP